LQEVKAFWRQEIDKSLDLDMSEFKDPAALLAYTGTSLFNKLDIIVDTYSHQDRYTGAISAKKI
jgi:hypothetical protein